jgi:hypothetical protein
MSNEESLSMKIERRTSLNTVEPDRIYLLRETPGDKIELVTTSKEGVTAGFHPRIEVVGPAFIYHTQAAVFTIQNYNDLLDYSVSTTDGVVSRDGAAVTLQVNDPAVESVTLTVGSLEMLVPVYTVYPIAPTITSLMDGETDVDAKNLQVSASAFLLNYPLNDATHASTDWQVSSDPNFENIVFESLEDSQNLTTITIP